MFMFMQKIILNPPPFFDILQILHTCYFEYFGHAWSHPLKAVAPTCKKLSCLSANKNQIDFSFLFRVLHFQKSYNIIRQENIGQ